MIITVFIQFKILSRETSWSAHMHTHTHRHYTHRSGVKNMAGLLFWKKKCLEVRVEGVQRGILLERKGKVIPCKWAADRNGTGTNSGKSGTRNLEAESIRNRAETMGSCIKLKYRRIM